MPTKKIQQKLLKHRICSIARVIACISFIMLVIIGVSSLARAMSLETVTNENGIPSSWEVASLGNPDSITIPITYWDQRQDDCNDPDRQFEWSLCRLYAKGIIKNVVKDHLGADGLPIPTYNNQSDAWAAYHDVFTANVIGNDPVQPSDNFYRWFHETSDKNGKQLSKRIDREVTFVRTGNNTYEYGSKGTFPLDDVDFSDADDATSTGHNFHFTAHMQIPMKIAADGSEKFWFSGDDDVWVFLNGQLVLDLGGLHMDTEGSFYIDQSGNVVSTVNNVADATCRQEKVRNPLLIGYDTYNNQVENNCQRQTKTTTINTNFKPGDVVNLDFFYAERSTSESNTRITISNMNWPISADSTLDGKIVGKLSDSKSNIVQYEASIHNRDPQNPLLLTKLATYISDTASGLDDKGNELNIDNSGFLALDLKTLYYTTTPDDESSWQLIDITPPSNSQEGFTLNQPIEMAPDGQPGDKLYFRFFAETSPYTGQIFALTSFYTELNGAAGITYDNDIIQYENQQPEPPTEYNLRIKYIYEDGSEAAPEHNSSHEPGSNFEIKSPDITDYLPDIPTVTGIFKDTDLTYIVTYKHKPVTPVTHTLKITYIYEDGSEAHPPHIETLQPGQEYNVPSPDIAAYTPDIQAVKGIVENDDITYVVTYKPKPTPEPETHTVTIHYLYKDGTKAHETYTHTYQPGDNFQIPSPEIDKHTADLKLIAGIVSNSDLEYIVYYTKNPEPILPDQPTTPNTPPVTPDTPPTTPEEPTTPITPEEPNLPAEPSTPNIPNIPDSDIIDDGLIYLAPLGQVAYVPNTGIVSDVLSSIFDQPFAEVILSQMFVLIVLAIFSGSFATFFSLRQYLNFEVSTRKTATRNVSSKSARSKSNTKNNSRKTAGK